MSALAHKLGDQGLDMATFAMLALVESDLLGLVFVIDRIDPALGLALRLDAVRIVGDGKIGDGALTRGDPLPCDAAMRLLMCAYAREKALPPLA